MLDIETKEPLKVSADGDPLFPYIMVPVEQLTAVEGILKAHKVDYWVDRDAISANGKPFVTVVNLGRGTDPLEIQKQLDAA